jgi:hypothetical protein
MKLVLNRLDQDAQEFKQTAVWNLDDGEPVPDEFTRIYPEEMWENRPPEYFIERIDGPYSILTRVDDDTDVEITPRQSSGEAKNKTDSKGTANADNQSTSLSDF